MTRLQREDNYESPVQDEYYYDDGAQWHDDLYTAAKCTTPHADGTSCMPTWDGFVYICLERL